MVKRLCASLPVVLGGTVLGTSHFLTGSPLAVPRQVASYMTDDDCGTTDAAEVQRASRIVGSADEPSIAVLDRVQSDEHRRLLRSRVVQRAANRHGLTVVDNRPYLSALKEAESVSEILRVFNTFSAKYGFELELHTGESTVLDRLDGTYPVRDGVDVDAFRKGAIWNVERMSLMPIELAHYAGVRKVDLFGRVESKGVPKGGLTSSGSTAIRLRLDHFQAGPSILLHEFGHHIAMQWCGIAGEARDTEIAKLNEPGFVYGRTGGQSLRGVAEPYGAESVAEDTATILEDLVAGLDSEVFHPRSDELGQKYDLWLSRLDQAVPGFVEYQRSISTNNRRLATALDSGL